MGSSGKGGGGGTDYSQAAYGNAYNAAQSGQSWEQMSPAFGGQNAQFQGAGLAGYEQGIADMQPVAMPEFGFEGFAMPDFGAAMAAQQSSYADALAAQQAAQEAAMAAAEEAAGVAERDSMFGSYMDAAGSATDYVNSEISSERSNARLLGIDYEMNDDMKNQRISDYFSTVWGEGEQARLEALMGEWGNPEGFTEFAVTRGDGGSYAKKTGGEKSVSTASGQTQRPTIATQDEEQGLGGQTTVLGV